MLFTITTGDRIEFTVSCDSPASVTVNEPAQIVTVVSVTKDGSSAYQIAVSNGFVGSEQDWLNMMYNPDGGIIF